MPFAQLVWNNTQEFCEKYALARHCSKVSNVYSIIVLKNDMMKFSFHVEEVELFLRLDVEFYNAAGEISKFEEIYDSQSERIVQLRRKALRAWRRAPQNAFLMEMVSEYIRIAEGLIGQ